MNIVCLSFFKSRPAYLTLPTDLAYTKIPSAPLKVPLKFEIPPNDPKAEKFVLDLIVDQVEKAAETVAVLVDACALRHHSIHEVRDFIANTKFPVYSAPMGKSVIHENDERFGGVSSFLLKASLSFTRCQDIHWSGHSS